MTGSSSLINTGPIIVTDSTCDLPPDLITQYDIRMVYLNIQFGQDTYRSGIDIDLPQFAELLERTDIHPTSSQPTVGEFAALYQSLAVLDRPILSIHVSEGLSGTVNAARQAAQQLPDVPVTVWDSRTISAELGMTVLIAARAAQAGQSVAEIIALLTKTHQQSKLLFSLDDLSYLVRGGRIGSVQYHVAHTLHIKPIITVAKVGEQEGTYISAGRMRNLDKAPDTFTKLIAKEVPEGDKLRIVSFYGLGRSPDLVARFHEKLQQRYDCVFMASGYSTPVLAVHVGIEALAVGFIAGDFVV